MRRITKIEPIVVNAKRKLRVAAYARVSTELNAQLISLDAQKNYYEKYIKSRDDWEFAGLYFDEGISGTSIANRQGLLSLIADCERGLIDRVIVKSISRFSRNTIDSVDTVRKLCGLGVSVFFEKENIDTGNMESELLLSILSSLAESESKSISQNANWSIQRRFKKGTYKIGYPPYGYDNVEGKMLINHEQAEVVKWIFKQFLSGVGASKIAKELNERKIKTKRNGNWTAHTIVGMLKNEKYTGDAIFQKTYSDDNFGRHINRGEKAQYYVKDHHEAIVTHEMFERANEMILRNGEAKGLKQGDQKCSNRYALTAKVICGECGSKMKRIKVLDYFAFGCNKRLKDVDKCSTKSVREDKIKAAFATMMNKLTFSREQILRTYQRNLYLMEKENFLDQISLIEEKMELNLEKRQQILMLTSKGFIDPGIYATEDARLNNEYEMLVKEKEDISKSISGNFEMKANLNELLHYTAKGQMLTEFNDELFLKFVDHIIVYGRTEVGFVMKCGPTLRERID